MQTRSHVHTRIDGQEDLWNYLTLGLALRLASAEASNGRNGSLCYTIINLPSLKATGNVETSALSF